MVDERRVRRSGAAVLVAVGCALLASAVLLVLFAGNRMTMGAFASVFMAGPTFIGAGVGLLIRWPVIACLVGLMVSVPLMAAFLLLLGC
jgi:hypothetical protein